MENHQLTDTFAIGLVGNILQRRIITKQDLEHLGPINFEDNKTKMVLKGEYFSVQQNFCTIYLLVAPNLAEDIQYNGQQILLLVIESSGCYLGSFNHLSSFIYLFILYYSIQYVKLYDRVMAVVLKIKNMTFTKKI